VEYLLMTVVAGTPASLRRADLPPAEIARRVGAAIATLHRTLGWRSCPVSTGTAGCAEVRRVVVHGDFCLPNILLREDGGFALIDVGELVWNIVGNVDDEVASKYYR
jgi:aminoglycoside phosphotransferase